MEPIQITVNGFDTYYVEAVDNVGKHLQIAVPPHADKSFSDICGQTIAGKYITQIDYTVNNGVRFVKAYYQ